MTRTSAPHMATLQGWVSAACQRLRAAGIDGRDASFDVEILARHALGWTRAQWLSRLRDQAPDTAGGMDALVGPLIDRRSRREPVALITGVREFWGLDMVVTPDVLIPRPETELLVEIALARLADPRRPWVIADVGTGSGCLAVALATEMVHARVVATDISPEALAVALGNAARHGVSDRVAFHETRFLDGAPGPYDLVVSNPPYIPDTDLAALAPEVARHEPRSALSGGRDGLDPARTLLPVASARLRGGAWLVMEIGVGQSQSVRDIAGGAALEVVEIRPDLQGIPRAVVMRRGAGP